MAEKWIAWSLKVKYLADEETFLKLLDTHLKLLRRKMVESYKNQKAEDLLIEANKKKPYSGHLQHPPDYEGLIRKRATPLRRIK
jgi:hypothetical protein